jgi:hypothetical protein
MNKETEKKLKEWIELPNKEKAKYNGFNGYLKGERWNQNNLFK